MANSVVMTSDTLSPGLKTFPLKLNSAVAKTMDYWAPQVESYARSNAPWTDRTGNARSGLHAETEHNGNISHSIHLFHTMPYGIWLEVRFDGRFAIINPTIDIMGHRLMATFRGLMGKLSAL